MQGGDSPKLKALIETWGGVWRRRRPLHKGKEEDQVGLFLDQSRCLAELLQHYPRIVYLGFTFWRKLLLYLHVRPDREHFEDVALYHPSASVINSHELAIVGNLDKLQLLFPPTSKFFSEKRPITRKTLIEADPGATSKRRVHTITEESLVTQFGFFLHWCILNQQKDVLDLVIGKLQLDLEGHYFSQWTPLVTAAQEGNTSIVNLLLSCGAKPDTQIGEQKTALHWAVIRGQLDVVKILCAAEASVNYTQSVDTHLTPLHDAVKVVDPGIVQLLVDYGADIDAEDELGLTAEDHEVFQHAELQLQLKTTGNGKDKVEKTKKIREILTRRREFLAWKASSPTTAMPRQQSSRDELPVEWKETAAAFE